MKLFFNPSPHESDEEMENIEEREERREPFIGPAPYIHQSIYLIIYIHF
jgi:hypothetical protein